MNSGLQKTTLKTDKSLIHYTSDKLKVIRCLEHKHDYCTLLVQIKLQGSGHNLQHTPR